MKRLNLIEKGGVRVLTDKGPQYGEIYFPVWEGHRLQQVERLTFTSI